MPYREPPRYLLCPRCTEMLEDIVPGVSMCTRCEGAWLTTRTLELAFGDPHWPQGSGMWWHNELACPECALEGNATIMDAKMASGVQLDSCAKHGLWLDRGELGRITNSADDELAVLFRRLQANVDPAKLKERRMQWRSDQQIQRQALGSALAAHARATEERVTDDVVFERGLAATAVVTRLEAKVAALRAELDVCTRDLAKAREVLAALSR